MRILRRLEESIWISLVAVGLTGCLEKSTIASKPATVEPSLALFGGIGGARSALPEATTVWWQPAKRNSVRGYRVYAQNFSKLLKDVPATETSVTLTGLEANAHLNFGVRSYDEAGVEDGNTRISGVTVLAYAPSEEQTFRLGLSTEADGSRQKLSVNGSCEAGHSVSVSLDDTVSTGLPCSELGQFSTYLTFARRAAGSYDIVATELNKQGVPSRPRTIGTLFQDEQLATLLLSHIPEGTSNESFVLPHMSTSHVASIRWALASGTRCDGVQLSEWTTPSSLGSAVFSDSGKKQLCLQARDNMGHQTAVFSKLWTYESPLTLSVSAAHALPGEKVTLTVDPASLKKEHLAQIDVFEHELKIATVAAPTYAVDITPSRGEYSFHAMAIYHGQPVLSKIAPLSVEGYEARVAFQSSAGTFTVPGYATESGKTYGPRGVFPYQYGWTEPFTGDCQPQKNIGSTSYLRRLMTDTRRFYGCDIHGRSWELEAPNGIYTVKVNQGTAEVATYWQGKNNVMATKVEGLGFVNDAWSPNHLFASALHDVTVTDGKITLQPDVGSGSYNLVNYIEVVDSRGNDLQAPSVPEGVTVKPDSFQTLIVTWNPSLDNMFVASYDVFVNGDFWGETEDTILNLTHLAPQTVYSVQIAAKDRAGNLSARSVPVEATTTLSGLHCPHTDSPLVSDGILTEPIWAKALADPFQHSSGPTELTAKVQCAWDERGIQFAITAAGPLGANEKVEVYFDSTNEKPTSYVRGHQFKLECPRGSPCLPSTHVASALTGVTSAYMDLAGRWTFEISLPWSNFPSIKPQAGRYFGFDIQIDHDGPNYPKLYWWQSYPETNWTGVTDFGSLVLE